MEFLKKNLLAIVGAGVILIGGYLYFMYFSGGSSGGPLVSQESVVSQDLLTTLTSLHTIKLDTSVFSDPSFQSLSDFGVIIPPQTAGRQNPFLPLTSLPSKLPSKK